MMAQVLADLQHDVDATLSNEVEVALRIIATTVVREAVRGRQRTGWIYDVDWEARRIRRRLPVPDPLYPETDSNPRGGMRGGRGVAPTPFGIVVANYDTLWIYDDDWNVLEQFSHPLFVGMHEIDWDGDHLWITATAIDVVLRVDLETKTVQVDWDPHAAGTAERLKLPRRPHAVDGSIDYRVREAPVIDQLHINGVTRFGGTTIVNCGLVRSPKGAAQQLADRVRGKLGGDRRQLQRRGSSKRGGSLVVRLNGSAQHEVLVSLPEHDVPTHNGQLLDETRVAVNDSTANTLRVFSLADQRELLALPLPGTWLRGLEPVDERYVFVGTAPATIRLVDLAAASFTDSLQLSEDPNEAIHGLALLR
jgi:hypothetical protein